MAGQTALVLKPITRCEFGTDALGFMAEAFDRVIVAGSRTFSTGNRQYLCVTESGETFYANGAMVQLD